MSHDITWPVLARHLAGECSPSEARAVESWMEADPTRRQMMDELERIWDASADAPSSAADTMDLDSEWNRLSDAMDAADARAPETSRVASSRADRSPRRHRQHRSEEGGRSLQHVLYAVLAGLVMVGAVWLALNVWESPLSDAGYREVVTERGERANVHLVDGTSVTLNVDSRLRTPRSFGDTERVVHLEGEAYFDVATDSTRSFIVHAEDAVINVHGTAFNVRSYPEDRHIQVAVVEGAVSLRSQNMKTPDADVRLESRQVGRLAKQTAHVTTQPVDSVGPLIGWMDDRLVFENETLPEVATRLGRWYNLQVEIADPALDSLRLTASLKSRSVKNVLDVIAASLDIQYHIRENTVVLADNHRDARLQSNP